MAQSGLVNFKSDIKEVTEYLTRLERRQVPFATRLALKNTAGHAANKVLPRVLPQIFDRPTRWTTSAFYAYQVRDKRELSASVNIKDGGSRTPGRGGGAGTPAFKYLRVQIAGGRRSAKSHEKKLRALGILGPDEYTVPGEDMRLNRFGNLTAATYAKILADVQFAGAGIDTGFGQRTTKRGRKRYFYSPNLLPRGIYERTGRRSLRVALLFVKAPRYRARFDFPGIVERSARREFPRQFQRAMARALATAR